MHHLSFRTALSLRIVVTLAGLAAVMSPVVSSLRAQSEPVTGLTTEVFDALTRIQKYAGEDYTESDVQNILHAIWWDLSYSPEEERLAKALRTAPRPVTFTAADGRTLNFTKRADSRAHNVQRFLLPTQFAWRNSSYYVEAFRNTKDAGVFVGACRVHENAAAVMENTLSVLINEARFAAKKDGDKPVLALFDALEASHAAANPAIQGEFADAVRRVLAQFEADKGAFPAAVRDAAWLRTPAGR